MFVDGLQLTEFTCLAVTAVAAGADLRTHRIPNLLTVPMIVAGLLVNSFGLPALGSLPEEVGLGWKLSLIGGSVGFGLTLLASVLSQGGGGDVKLATALGTLLGPREVFVILAATFISAAVCTISFLVIRDGIFSTLRLLTTPTQNSRMPPSGSRRARKSAVAAASPPSAASLAVPMGPYFFVGTLAVAVMKAVSS